MFCKKYCSLFCVLAFSLVSNITGAELQDSKAAYEYFSHELEFNANSHTVLDVVEGRLEGTIIDVRRRANYDQGHIPGAISLPFDEYNVFRGDEKEFPGLSKDSMNYIYCYELLCTLAQRAAQKLSSLGYPVKEVKGGFKTWVEKDYPVEISKED